MKKQIKTRIAPSPTGNLHIGTVRTALFNFLFAKKNSGNFVVRIEDTDLKRSKKEFEQDIINGLKWLGIKSDEPISYQTDRIKIYDKYIEILLKKKMAYEKDKAIWFDLNSYPKNTIEYHDLIMGNLKFPKKNFNDFVIRKSDQIPLYMFAATIDDYDMQITHVIRGSDHINSTPQQIMLYESLGFELPSFGHIPLILNSDRSKISKRENPVSITHDFKEQGYLPEAIINYIAFLGWNPKNDQEFFTINELIKEFDIKKINKSGAIFDIKKLNYFNNHYINKLSDQELLIKIKQINKKINNFEEKKLLKTINIIKPRLNNLIEFNQASYFFCLPEYKSQMLIFKKSTKEKTYIGLKKTIETLQEISIDIWKEKEKINEILQKIVSINNLTNGDIFWPIRVALSGLEKSPSPTELLWVLGKKESILRLKKAIKKL